MKVLPASPRHFLTREERERVMEAIRHAESGTSAEIRVHVERRCPGTPPDPLRRAELVFHRLRMTATAQRNGVLIYIALAEKQFAVWGDEGIHRHVGEAYWTGVRDGLAERFRNGEYCDGLCEAIARIGGTLRSLFPPRPGDVNELPEEISTGDD